MMYSTKDIMFDSGYFYKLRTYLKHIVEEAKSDKMTKEELIDSLESCLTEPPLLWDNCVIVRAVKNEQ